MKYFQFLLYLAAFSLGALFSTDSEALTARKLTATKVTDPPEVDGHPGDAAWSKATPLTTYDALAEAELTIRAVYSGDTLYILATFPDQTENRDHKTQLWVPDQARYRIGPDREDTFVLKWSMEARPIDLRVDADHPYKADIWYWKAHRTDHAGYADDKMHIYTNVTTPKSKRILSKNGGRFFLLRPGDGGSAAYRTLVHGSHIGDRTPLYERVAPRGSRADVKAKGLWRDGIWTVEFARKLKTGHADDIQFDTGRDYYFGVSRFEIAGRKKNARIQEPYFGAGEITELLSISFR